MEEARPPSRPTDQPWLVGGGEMAKVILAKDWSRTALGPMEFWPPSLRTSVSLVLNSNFPIALAWGPRHIQIYNDGYWPLCGDKHPEAMGQDFSECWASAFPVIGEAFRSALAGTAAYLQDQRMFLDRLGFLEETFFTFSFSPIRDETGAVAGLFHPVNETTSRMLSERRTRTLRDLAAIDVKRLSIDQTLERVAQVLAESAFDVPFALFYRVDEAGGVVTLAAQVGLSADDPAIPARVDLGQGEGPWRLAEGVAHLETLRLDDLVERCPGLAAGPYPEPVRTALVYPLRLAGQAKACGLMVAGVSTRLPFNDVYRAFLDLLAGTVEAMIANATAFAEERRRATALGERQFRNLAEAMPQIVWMTRADGWNVYFNQQWVDYTGMTLEESYGHGWNIPFHPEDRQRAWDAWQNAVQNRGEYVQECRLRRADGEYRWWLIRGVPQVDAAGEIIQWYGTCTDIDDMKRQERERLRLESQIMKAQKMDSLGSLAGGVAHDMNNVLGAILALVSMHQIKSQGDPGLAQDLETIVQACLRGGNLVKGLLGFARTDLVEERPVDLNAVVREEVNLLERTTLQKVRLVMDLDPDLPAVMGDRGALHHSLMNLCVNAVDAMAEGGELLLRTRREPAGWVLLEVADTGMGMPQDILDKAMDPFFTTKAQGKGTGLGLSIVYGTVKTHRGRIEIQSEPGTGTRVALRFPAAQPVAPPAAGPGPGAPRPAGQGLRILVVDDDELILQSIPSLLGALGHTVSSAPGGAQALAMLAAGDQPEVVVLDMNMPGLDGPATLARIRAIRPTLPVLLATGRADQTALDLVASDRQLNLLAKPFGLEEIQAGLAWAAKAGP